MIFSNKYGIYKEKLNEIRELGSEMGKMISSLINSIKNSMS
jgi:hypothetical protein